MDQELTLRIVLERPPAGVDYGLQKGSGANYTTVQKQRSTSRDLYFEFTVRVKTSNNLPNLLGPFVQGPAGSRFVYIDIGTYAGQSDSVWGRRLKIPLEGITTEMINQSLENPDLIFVANVLGTGKDKGPNCGTVKPFNGWHLMDSKTS